MQTPSDDENFHSQEALLYNNTHSKRRTLKLIGSLLIVCCISFLGTSYISKSFSENPQSLIQNDASSPVVYLQNLSTNTYMYVGDVLLGQNGQCYLTIQTDGNVVLYSGSYPNTNEILWSPNINTASYMASQSSDCNVIAYTSSGAVAYQSNTGNQGGKNCYLQLYDTPYGECWLMALGESTTNPGATFNASVYPNLIPNVPLSLYFKTFGQIYQQSQTQSSMKFLSDVFTVLGGIVSMVPEVGKAMSSAYKTAGTLVTGVGGDPTTQLTNAFNILLAESQMQQISVQVAAVTTTFYDLMLDIQNEQFQDPRNEFFALQNDFQVIINEFQTYSGPQQYYLETMPALLPFSQLVVNFCTAFKILLGPSDTTMQTMLNQMHDVLETYISNALNERTQNNFICEWGAYLPYDYYGGYFYSAAQKCIDLHIQIKTYYAAYFESFLATVAPTQRTQNLKTYLASDVNLQVQEISNFMISEASGGSPYTVIDQVNFIYTNLQRFGVNIAVLGYSGPAGFTYWAFQTNINTGAYSNDISNLPNNVRYVIYQVPFNSQAMPYTQFQGLVANINSNLASIDRQGGDCSARETNLRNVVNNYLGSSYNFLSLVIQSTYNSTKFAIKTNVQWQTIYQTYGSYQYVVQIFSTSPSTSKTSVVPSSLYCPYGDCEFNQYPVFTWAQVACGSTATSSKTNRRIVAVQQGANPSYQAYYSQNTITPFDLAGVTQTWAGQNPTYFDDRFFPGTDGGSHLAISMEGPNNMGQQGLPVLTPTSFQWGISDSQMSSYSFSSFQCYRTQDNAAYWLLALVLPGEY